MDYTANHHLPQWVKSDRIMMDDFNQMCRDIENGLNKTQSNANDGMTQVRTDLGGRIDSTQTEQTRLLDFLGDVSRDAYRQAVQQRVFHGPAGLYDSLWLNSLSSFAETGGQWAGSYGILLGGNQVTEAGIKNSVNFISSIKKGPPFSQTSNYAAIDFSSNGYGVLTQMLVYGRRLDNTDHNPAFTVYLRRTDNGALVNQSVPLPLAEGAKYGLVMFNWELNFPLAPGIPYRLEFSVADSDPFLGEVGFDLGSPLHGNAANMFALAAGSGTAAYSHTITPPEWAKGGTGIVRWSGSGSVTLSVNGQNLPVRQNRDAVNAQGWYCRETEYELETLPGRSMTFSLHGTKDGDLCLFDFGMLWK